MPFLFWASLVVVFSVIQVIVVLSVPKGRRSPTGERWNVFKNLKQVQLLVTQALTTTAEVIIFLFVAHGSYFYVTICFQTHQPWPVDVKPPLLLWLKCWLDPSGKWLLKHCVSHKLFLFNRRPLSPRSLFCLLSVSFFYLCRLSHPSLLIPPFRTPPPPPLPSALAILHFSCTIMVWGGDATVYRSERGDLAKATTITALMIFAHADRPAHSLARTVLSLSQCQPRLSR